MVIPLAGWVAPFGDPRIHGRSPLPSAFRSVPRPSSPLGTKAFTRCPSLELAHAQPQARASRAQMAAGRTQRAAQRYCCLLPSDRCPLKPIRKHHRCLRIGVCIPMPRSSQTERLDLRFTVTTRFTMSKIRWQRAEARPHGSGAPLSVITRGPRCQKTCSETFRSLLSVLCHLNLVGLGRLERPTSRLSGVRSNQLSYRPRWVRGQQAEGSRQPRMAACCRLRAAL